MRHRLVSPGAERFLPFAESCITKLKKLGLPYADQSYEVDGASIKVRIEPGHEYIRIEGGGGKLWALINIQTQSGNGEYTSTVTRSKLIRLAPRPENTHQSKLFHSGASTKGEGLLRSSWYWVDNLTISGTYIRTDTGEPGSYNRRVTSTGSAIYDSSRTVVSFSGEYGAIGAFTVYKGVPVMASWGYEAAAAVLETFPAPAATSFSGQIYVAQYANDPGVPGYITGTAANVTSAAGIPVKSYTQPTETFYIWWGSHRHSYPLRVDATNVPTSNVDLVARNGVEVDYMTGSFRWPQAISKWGTSFAISEPSPTDPAGIVKNLMVKLVDGPTGGKNTIVDDTEYVLPPAYLPERFAVDANTPITKYSHRELSRAYAVGGEFFYAKVKRGGDTPYVPRMYNRVGSILAEDLPSPISVIDAKTCVSLPVSLPSGTSAGAKLELFSIAGSAQLTPTGRIIDLSKLPGVKGDAEFLGLLQQATAGGLGNGAGGGHFQCVSTDLSVRADVYLQYDRSDEITTD